LPEPAGQPKKGLVSKVRIRLAAVLLGLLVFGADIITKLIVKNTAWLHYHPVIDGFFTIRYVRNEGIAFGLLHDLQSEWKPIVLSIMAVVAVVIVLYYVVTTPTRERRLFLSLGLLLGGILGNFTDRLLHQHVIDFLELHWSHHFAWPTFNIADAAITTGVLLILYETFFGEETEERQGERASQTVPNNVE
jgi:signal peptidase II